MQFDAAATVHFGPGIKVVYLRNRSNLVGKRETDCRSVLCSNEEGTLHRYVNITNFYLTRKRARKVTLVTLFRLRFLHTILIRKVQRTRVQRRLHFENRKSISSFNLFDRSLEWRRKYVNEVIICCFYFNQTKM